MRFKSVGHYAMTHVVVSLTRVQSDYDDNVWVIYSKIGLYCLWGIMTATFRPLTHPRPQHYYFIFRKHASVKRMRHSSRHRCCVIQKITQHPPLSNSFWLRSSGYRKPHGKKFALGKHFKISPNDLFIDGNNCFLLWIFFTARLLSVFTCWLVLCIQEWVSWDQRTEWFDYFRC